MADEVDFSIGWFKRGDAIPFTVADGTGIEKGSWLALSDPMTAAANAANGGKMAGVLFREKVASDGRTKVDVLMDGVIPATCSGTVTLGAPLTVYNNRVQEAGLTASGLALVGTALETGSDGEVIMINLAPGTGGTAKA